MAIFLLEGGTDAGEMAFFSLDDMLPEKADDAILSDLESKGHAFRFVTGADGAYLLHLYLDENIPQNLHEYCSKDDLKQFSFHAPTGKVAFGGVESACALFSPNPGIRADIKIPAGTYQATAYRTEFPDDYVEDLLEAKIGSAGAKCLGLAGKIFGGGILLTIIILALTFIVSKFFSLLLIPVILGAIEWINKHMNSEEYKKYDQEKTNIEQECPSIVIQMKLSIT